MLTSNKHSLGTPNPLSAAPPCAYHLTKEIRPCELLGYCCPAPLHRELYFFPLFRPLGSMKSPSQAPLQSPLSPCKQTFFPFCCSYSYPLALIASTFRTPYGCFGSNADLPCPDFDHLWLPCDFLLPVRSKCLPAPQLGDKIEYHHSIFFHRFA